jgi:hypothetical protein
MATDPGPGRVYPPGLQGKGVPGQVSLSAKLRKFLGKLRRDVTLMNKH